MRENIKHFLLYGKKLDLNGFNLTQIPDFLLNHKILELDISNNPNFKLDNYFKLKILKCNFINCSRIPSYPNLKELYCIKNNIYELPCFKQLEILHCQDNFITHIPTMPNLKEIRCINNPIKTIAFQPKLERLYISTNNITKLPLLPKLKKIIIVNFHTFMNYRFLEDTCNLRSLVIQQKCKYLKYYIHTIKMQTRFRKKKYRKILKNLYCDISEKIIEYII